MGVELYPHQIQAIKDMGHGKVLMGGVGSGKTRTALAYFYMRVCGGSLSINGVGKDLPPKKPRDIYVITTARKRDEMDWQEEAIPFHLGSDPKYSIKGITLTVDSYNNIKNYVDVKNAFFIFDEQRLVGSGTWVKAFYKIAKNNWWIMLSATPGDTWMDYMPLFVANGFYKNKTEFCDNHVIYSRFSKFPMITGYHRTGVLQKHRQAILVDMPVKRHTKRHIHYIDVDHDPKLYETITKKRWNPYDEEPITQAGTATILQRKAVNSDPSRLKEVQRLLKENKRVIIFYSFDYELEELRKIGDLENIKVAEWNGHKHETVPLNDRWVYLVQYVAGNEAWNCIKTDTMVFYSMQYSYRIFEQCLGRIDRINTKYTDLHYYVMRSKTPIDKALYDVIKTKKNFNEKAFGDKYVT